MRLLVMLSLSLSLSASSFNEVEPSTPEEILSLNSGLLIEGYVSPFSGHMVISETDLSVRGASDLTLKRSYVTPQILGCYKHKKKEDLLYTGYALRQLLVKGWVVNPHLVAGYNLHSPYFQLVDPQGFVLEFAIQGNQGVLKTSSYGCTNLSGETPSGVNDLRNIQLCVENSQIKVTWPNGTQREYSPQGGTYLLQRERLPNGKMICYSYERDQIKISSSDPSGKYIYGSIIGKGNQYIGSDGRGVTLDFEVKEIKGKSKKKGYRSTTTFFPVMTRSIHPTYTNTMGYNEKILLNQYDAQSYPISCTYFERKDEPLRLETFSTPSGTTTFSYDGVIPGVKGGSTTVTHPDGAQTVYRFTSIYLIEAIENWNEGKLVNQKKFSYDSKQHVESIETRDQEGSLLIAKRFVCDFAGNPTLETIEGDFGTFSIRRKFDQNRLVFEDRDDGLQTEWSYLGQTWLPTSKTTYEREGSPSDFPKTGKQLRKTIYHYDEANNVRLIEEEGKTRKIYTLYQTAPHLHRVEWEEMRDWEGNLIDKTQYQYDQWGYTAKEERYGSDGKLAYTIERNYNEKGELLSETNPLGDEAVYKYDSRGRCDFEEPISNGLTITRTFDGKGRLRILREGDRETLFDYNPSDELIEKTDFLGYVTRYKYHPVHGKPIRVEEADAVTEFRYDPWGREIEMIDPYGAQTKRKYNSYGDIAWLAHPEGGEEHFEYFPNGLLKTHTDPDGLIAQYNYDALGRIQNQQVGSYTTTYFRDGYHLNQVIDAAGFITEYQYDLSGRKVEERREGRITRFGYDPLGFLSSEERGNRRTEYTNDFLGRVRKETIDGLLTTSWSYDRGGQIATIERGGIATFRYDEHNRLVEKVDPEGFKTEISYSKGAQTLIKKIIDATGVETLETYDPKGNLLKKEVAGEVTLTFEYDKLFRLKRQDHLTYGYNENGMQEWLQEADQRITRWTYTPGNRRLTQEKGDGTILLHQYDAQRRLERIGNREFRYDPLDRIIGGTGFTRILDPFGNIKREEWSNGLWIESDYDDSDRPILRTLPDLTQIQYEYRGPFLQKATRLSSAGEELYSHTYDQYDRNGNPHSQMGFFETISDYDHSGRMTLLKTPYYSEAAQYDPLGNLKRKGGSVYTYDALSQMTSESRQFTARYDIHHNLKELNGQPVATDALNRIEGLSYDLNGNLLRTGFVYDEFDQLIESGGERSVYDALGRRLQKGKIAFLYVGDEEIGAFEEGEAKEIKIIGLKEPIAIEIERKPHAPVIDIQGTIRLLIDPQSAAVTQRSECDAFGRGVTDAIPYAYCGKRYDPNTGLLYFGKRYYDPLLQRWITPDPLGPIDHSNLYQYVFNNPYRYRDPNGEFAFALPLLFWGAELAIPALSACISTVVYGAAAGALAYGGYKLVETFNEQGYPSMGDYYSGDLTPYLNNWSYSTMKSGSVDPTLPANPDDLLKRPGWKETTHPDAGKSGHRTFENGKTGERLRHDQGKAGESGHRAHDHYHRDNPKSTGNHDKYLDAKGKPVKEKSNPSHIYHPDKIWWKK